MNDLIVNGYFVWIMCCVVVGGFHIGMWAAKGLQRLCKASKPQPWTTEDILRREG